MVIGVDEKERRRKARNEAKAGREQDKRDEYARRRDESRRTHEQGLVEAVGLTAAIIRQREANAKRGQ